MLPRLRAWLADRIDALAVVLWSGAHRLRPVYAGPLCPDCELEPDHGPDVECPGCVMRAEQREDDERAYASGFEDGRRDAYRALEGYE